MALARIDGQQFKETQATKYERERATASLSPAGCRNMPPCFEEVRRLAVIALAISLRQRSPWEATGGLLEVGPRDWQALVMPSPPGPPMILGNMRSLGVRSLAVTCELCHLSTPEQNCMTDRLWGARR